MPKLGEPAVRTRCADNRGESVQPCGDCDDHGRHAGNGHEGVEPANPWRGASVSVNERDDAPLGPRPTRYWHGHNIDYYYLSIDILFV